MYWKFTTSYELVLQISGFKLVNLRILSYNNICTSHMYIHSQKKMLNKIPF
jgi:hypothetical protein